MSDLKFFGCNKGVEGSHDAFERSLLREIAQNDDIVVNQNVEHKESQAVAIDKENIVVEHDFSRGPWWPEDTVDAVWCVELLEHVSRNYAVNYLTAFKKAALIFVTHTKWGGWHHVEVHDAQWWRSRMSMYGFQYSEELTERIKWIAEREIDSKIPLPGKVIEDVKKNVYNAQHVWLNGLVFINPAVASRPRHAHLFSEPGCFFNKTMNVHCGENDSHISSELADSKLPNNFKHIPYIEARHKLWEELVVKNVEKERMQQK